LSQRTVRAVPMLLLIVMGLLNTGCSPAGAAIPSSMQSPTSTTRPRQPTPNATPSPVQLPITVTDAAGQTVMLDEVPARLVVVGRGPYMGLHLLYMFPTAWIKLVGLEQKGSTADDFLPLVDPGWTQKTILATGPGVEQIAALKPDLVITKGIVPDTLSNALAEVNIPSLFLSPETPDQFYQDVINLGVVLGQPERAMQIIDYYQQRLDRIQQRLSGIPEDDKPDILLLQYTERGGSLAMNVPAKSWMQTILVQLAGGHPVWLESAAATAGWTVANLEQIALWNPDKILLVLTYDMNAHGIIAALRADPVWSQLRAVQNRELYAFPLDLYDWDSPGPRWILGVNWLATRLYPDRFADIDMSSEIYDFYGYFYEMDRATVNEHIMPLVHLDVH